MRGRFRTALAESSIGIASDADEEGREATSGTIRFDLDTTLTYPSINQHRDSIRRRVLIRAAVIFALGTLLFMFVVTDNTDIPNRSHVLIRPRLQRPSAGQSAFSVNLPRWTSKNKRAFVFYMTEKALFEMECALHVQVAALKKVGIGTATDIVVLSNAGSLDEAHPALKGVHVVSVPQPIVRGAFQWEDSFTKLFWATLVQYEVLVYLDLDVLILRSLDELFAAAPLPSTHLAAPRAYWRRQPLFQSGGPVVVRPSHREFARHYESLLYGGTSNSRHDAVPVSAEVGKSFDSEMDWINVEFRDSAVLLDGFYALLVAEWIPRDSAFGHFGRLLNASSAEVLAQARVVHFIAEHKPWKTTRERLKETYPTAPAELFQVFERWWALRDEVCTPLSDSSARLHPVFF